MIKRRGFTLIEVIVVIVILGILAMLAIPAYGAVQEKAKVETLKTEMRSQARALVSESALVGPDTEVLSLSGVSELPDDYELFKLASDLRLTAKATDEFSCEVVVYHTATASDVTCEEVQESIEPDFPEFITQIFETVSNDNNARQFRFIVSSPYSKAYDTWLSNRRLPEPIKQDYPRYIQLEWKRYSNEIDPTAPDWKIFWEAGQTIEYSWDWELSQTTPTPDWCVAFVNQNKEYIRASSEGVQVGKCF